MSKTTTQPLTVDSLVRRYAEDIAFVAEEDEDPATTLDDFLQQLAVTAERLEEVRLDEEGEAASAATYLADAAAAEGAEQQVLLKQADRHLREASIWIDEYRDMV